MRRVFSNDMTAHVWAQQTQDEGRSSHGNISFGGTVFYSYSTPIANFVTDKDGVRVALFSRETYSPSTGQHMNRARGAVGYDAPNTYTVKHLGVGGRSPRLNLGYNVSEKARLAAAHAANVADMIAEYAKDVASAKRARLRRYGLNREAFETRAARIAEYASRFGVKLTKKSGLVLPDVAADWQAIEAAEANRKTPEAIAKAEKAAARRIEKKRWDYREIRGTYDENFDQRFRHSDTSFATEEDKRARATKLGLLNQAKINTEREAFRSGQGRYGVGYNTRAFDIYAEHFTDADKAMHAEAVAKQIERLRDQYRTVTGEFDTNANFRQLDHVFTDEDRAARTARLAEIEADKVKAWREGVNVQVPHNRESGAMLRLSRDGSEVQTSWGARFPVEHARKAFPAINRVRETGREYKRNGHNIHLGHFVIDAVSANGDVYAGCHFVRWAEIERVARQLGLLPPDQGVSAAA